MVMLTLCIFLFLWFDHTSLTPESTTATEKSQQNRLNINSATVEELQTLPGIGPKLADAIITYRTAHGPFQSIGQLTDVPGIGDGKLENIAQFITVGG